MFSLFPLGLSAQPSEQEDCDFDNADGTVFTRLTIGLLRETITYEDCSIIPLTVDVTTPESGSGSLEVCVELQGATTEDVAIFNVIDAENFTLVSTSNVGIETYCQTITYPNPAAEFEDTRIQRMYMSLVAGSNGTGKDLVQGSRAIITDLASNSSCATPRISTGFRQLSPNLTDGSTPVTLTQVEDNSRLNRFPAPDLAPTRATFAVLDGTLIIDKDYDLGSANTGTFRNELVMLPGAMIRIAQGVTANLSRLDIRGCQTMYNGVIVEDGATLTVDDVTIQDGEHAFQVEDGGSLTVRESNFDNNHVSIAVLKTGSTGKSVEINSIGNHFGFDYRSDFGAGVGITDPLPALLPPYAGENPAAAADFNEVTAGIVFMNSPTRGENVIEFHQNGITLDESSITISGTRFQDIESITPKIQTGYGVLSKPNSSGSYRRRPVKVFQNDLAVPASRVYFERMDVAIGDFNASPMRIFDIFANSVNTGVYLFGDSFLRLKDSDITAAHFGVNKIGDLSWFTDDTRITDNTIRVIGDDNFDGRPAGIRYLNARQTQLGIVRHRVKDNDIILDGAEFGVRVIASSHTRIDDNHITWDSDQFATYGISLEGVDFGVIDGNLIEGFVGPTFSEATAIRSLGGDENTISCNTVDKVETGALFFGDNNETDFKGNNFYETGVGLQLGLDVPADPSLMGRQIHRGNEWIGPFTSSDEAVYYNDSNDEGNLDLSLFRVWSGINNDFLPTTNVSPSSVWFINTSTNSNSTYECANPIPTDPPINPLAELVFANNYLPDSEWSAMNWLAQFKIAKAINEGRISSNDYPGRNGWMQTSTYMLADTYVQAKDDIKQVSSVTPNEQLWLETADAQHETDLNIYSDNSIAKYLDAPNYTTSMEQSRLQAKGRMVQADSDDQPVYTTLDNRLISNAQSVASTIAALPVGNVAQQYTKTLNSITFAVMLNPGNRWSDFSLQVATIASSCPLKGGNAVYKARGIASLLGISIPVDSYDNCLPPPTPKSAKKEKVKNLQFKTFPNPSNGLLTINYPAKDYSIRLVQLYDANGIMLYSMKPNKTADGVLRIDARNYGLKSGMYQLRLVTSLNEVILEKLIIEL